MLLGLAIGDALGSTLEFTKPTKANPIEPVHDKITGGGPTGVPAGYFNDDTSMVVAMAASIMGAVLFHGHLDDVYDEQLGHPEKFDDRGAPYSGGYVKVSFSVSCYEVRNSSSFLEALIRAVM
jgi:ADP-ribosylglycohydrolase